MRVPTRAMMGAFGAVLALSWPVAAAGQEAGTQEAGAQEAGADAETQESGARDSMIMPAEESKITSLELTGYVGALLPLSALGAEGDSIRSEFSTRPSYAASLDYWFGGSLGIGIMAGYTKPTLNLTTVDAGNLQQNIADLGSADYLHGEVLILFRPQLMRSAAILLPYIGVGVGYVDLTMPEDSNFEDSSSLAFALALGTHLRVSNQLHLRLDVRDLVSSFEGGPFADGNVQHDVFIQVGVGVGL